MAEGIEVRNGKLGKTYRAAIWSAKDGKLIRKTFPTMAAAKSWRRDAGSQLSRGLLRPASSVTVREAARDLLEGIKSGAVRTGKGGRRYKPATIRSYERSLRLRVLPALGQVKLSDIRKVEIRSFIKRLQSEGLSGSSIRNTLDPLRVILREAREDEIIATDPMRGLVLPTDENKRDRIADPEEAQTLLDALPLKDRALWATAMFGGLRRGEIRALRVDDLNLSGGEIRVERTWDDTEGPVTPKSDAGRRIVPLFGLLRGYLTDHLLDNRRGGEDLVFGRTDSDPFVPSTVRNRALAVWEKAGLEPIGLHECRHSFASMLIDAGGNAKALQDALGHASIQMTWDKYGHLMPGGRDELRKRLDEYLGDHMSVGTHG